MPKVYKAKDIYKFLLKNWFQQISQKWSHIKLKDKNKNIVILPMHNKDIPYGTFVSILSQSKLTMDVAREFLGK
jgi:predicted RNA binding protein YcfA (HicA-like mRNA interferase family)